MELGLSLGGDATNSNNKPIGSSSFLISKPSSSSSLMALGFCVGLGSGLGSVHDGEGRDLRDEDEDIDDDDDDVKTGFSGLDRPIQLDLLPLAPVPRSSSSHLPFPWLSHHCNYSLSFLAFH